MFATCKFHLIKKSIDSKDEENEEVEDAISDFCLKQNVNYEIKRISFFGVYPIENSKTKPYLVSAANLRILFNGLAETKIIETLEEVCVHPTWFDPMTLGKILEEAGFKVPIITDFQLYPKK